MGQLETKEMMAEVAEAPLDTQAMELLEILELHQVSSNVIRVTMDNLEMVEHQVLVLVVAIVITNTVQTLTMLVAAEELIYMEALDK